MRIETASLELFREWSEKGINCKVLGQTGSLAEFSHGILEKLYGNSRIRRIRLYNIMLEKNLLTYQLHCLCCIYYVVAIILK